MILVALGLLFTVAFAVGTAAPAGAGAIAAGRSQFLAVAADRAARGAVADWFESGWVDSTAGRVPGAAVVFSPLTGPGLRVDRTLHAIGGDLWLLEARVALLDAAGGELAASRHGWLARAGAFPAGSGIAAWLVSRWASTGYQ